MAGNRVIVTLFIAILGVGVLAHTAPKTQETLDRPKDATFAQVPSSFAQISPSDELTTPTSVVMSFVEVGDEAFNEDEGRRLSAQEAQDELVQDIRTIGEKAQDTARSIEHLEQNGRHATNAKRVVRQVLSLLDTVKDKKIVDEKLIKTLQNSVNPAANHDAKVLSKELKNVIDEAKNTVAAGAKVCKRMGLKGCPVYHTKNRLPGDLVDEVKSAVHKHEKNKETAEKSIKKVVKALKRAKNSIIPRIKNRMTSYGIHKHSETRIKSILKKAHGAISDKIFKLIVNKLTSMKKEHRGLLRLGDKARRHSNRLPRLLKQTVKKSIKSYVRDPITAKILKKRIISILLRAQANGAKGSHSTGIHKHFLEKLDKAIKKHVKNEEGAKNFLARIHARLELLKKNGLGLIKSGTLKKDFKKKIRDLIGKHAEDKEKAKKLTKFTLKALRRAKRTKVQGRRARSGIPKHIAIHIREGFKKHFTAKDKTKMYKAIRAVFGTIKKRYAKRYISYKFKNRLRGAIARNVKDRKLLRKVHRFVVKTLNRAKRSKVPLRLSPLGIPVHIARYLRDNVPKLFGKDKTLGQRVLRDLFAVIWDKRGIHGFKHRYFTALRATINSRVKERALASAVYQVVIRNMVRSYRSKTPLKVGHLGIRTHLAVKIRSEILKLWSDKNKESAFRLINGIFKILKRAYRDTVVKGKTHKGIKTVINSAIKDKKKAKSLYWAVVKILIKDRKSRIRVRRNRLGIASHIGILLRQKIRAAFPEKRSPAAVKLISKIFGIIRKGNKVNIVSHKVKNGVKKALEGVVNDKKVRRKLVRAVVKAVRAAKRSSFPARMSRTGLPTHIQRSLVDSFRAAVKGKNKAPAYKALKAVSKVLKKTVGKGAVKESLRRDLKKIIFAGADKSISAKLFVKVYKALARGGRSKVPRTRLSKIGIPAHIARLIFDTVTKTAPAKERKSAHKLLRQIFEAIKRANPKKVKRAKATNKLKRLLSKVITEKKVLNSVIAIVLKNLKADKKLKKQVVSKGLGIAVKTALAIRDAVRNAIPDKNKAKAYKVLRVIYSVIRGLKAKGSGSSVTRRNIKRAIKGIIKDSAIVKKMMAAVKFVIKQAKISKVPLVLSPVGLQTHLVIHLRDAFRKTFPAKKRAPAYKALAATFKILKSAAEVQSVPAVLLRRVRQTVKKIVTNAKVAELVYHGIADSLWRGFRTKVPLRLDKNGLPTQTAQLIVDRTVKNLANEKGAKELAAKVLEQVFKLLKNTFSRGTITNLLIEDLEVSLKKVKGIDNQLVKKARNAVTNVLLRAVRSHAPTKRTTKLGLPKHLAVLLRANIKGLVKGKKKDLAVRITAKVFKFLKRRFGVKGVNPRLMIRIRKLTDKYVKNKALGRKAFKRLADAYLKQQNSKGELKISSRIGLTQSNGEALRKSILKLFGKDKKTAYKVLAKAGKKLRASFRKSQVQSTTTEKVLHSSEERREETQYPERHERRHERHERHARPARHEARHHRQHRIKPEYVVHGVEIPQMFRGWFEENYDRNSLPPKYHRRRYSDIVRAWRITKHQRKPEAVHELLRVLGEHPSVLE